MALPGGTRVVSQLGSLGLGTRDTWRARATSGGWLSVSALGIPGELGGFRGNNTRWTRGALGGFRGNNTRGTRGALGGFRGNITRWTRTALGGFRGWLSVGFGTRGTFAQHPGGGLSRLRHSGTRVTF